MPTAELVLHTESLNDGQSIHIPPSAHTLAGFRAWAKSDHFPQRGKYAFIGGTLYADLTMEEIETHNKVKTEITSSVYQRVKGKALGELYSDGVLVTNTEADVSNEPDAAFVAWATFESGRAHVIPREGHEGQFTEIEGTPDWMLEIVSRGSVVKDTKLLLEHYHRAGVREYWLVDARGAEIDFRILHRGGDGYAAAEVRNEWQRSEVFGCWFRLTRERGRQGRWQYTLECREDIASQ
jgi:Uma2 family endonuclease